MLPHKIIDRAIFRFNIPFIGVVVQQYISVFSAANTTSLNCPIGFHNHIVSTASTNFLVLIEIWLPIFIDNHI